MLVDNVEMVMNTKILLTIFTIVLELMYGNKGRRGEIRVSIKNAGNVKKSMDASAKVTHSK